MDRFEKFVLKIAGATQLDDNFRQAANEDFENFSEKDYGLIREYILSRVNEATIRDSEDPVEAAFKIRHEIAQIIEVDPSYIKSKIRRWALSLLKEVIDTFDEDFSNERDLNEKLLSTARDRSIGMHKTIGKLTELLSQNEDSIQTVHLGTSMHQFGEIICKAEEIFVFDETAKNFIKEITALIKKCKRNFNSQEIGSILRSLQNLPDCEEARSLIDALCDSLEHYNPPVDSKCVGMSLYGLQNMDLSPETLRVLKFFENKIKTDNIKIDDQGLVNGVWGLQKIINSEELRELKEVLLSQIMDINPDYMDPTNLLSLVQAFKIADIKIPYYIWMKYQDHINKYTNRDFASEWERKVFRAIMENFKSWPISHNFFMDGFELDIYFRDLQINIELDGPYHKINSPYEEKRDQYLLEKKEVSIIRIPYGAVSNEEEILKIINSELGRH